MQLPRLSGTRVAVFLWWFEGGMLLPLIWFVQQRWAQPRAQQPGSPKTNIKCVERACSLAPIRVVSAPPPNGRCLESRPNQTHFRAQEPDADRIELAFFRAKHEVARASGTGLSVPSSSGNTLQPARPVCMLLVRFSFSPLFIGEYSSTTAPECPFGEFVAPFSPLFIGEYSSTLRCSFPDAAICLAFSPLFIGEYSST
jgi:hypothetical protein